MPCALRGSINGDGLSFASARAGSSNEETLSVKINVLPESPLSSKIAPQIENLENKRADQGQSSVDQDRGFRARAYCFLQLILPR